MPTPAHAPDELLRVTDLAVTLDRRVVLEHVSLTLHRGEVLTVLGPNGAGKTVLLRALLGAVRPSAGRVSWREGVRVGYVPQRVPYVRSVPLTVGEFLALRRPGPHDAAAQLAAVGLAAEVADRLVGEVSSGQFQRILVARALAADPDVLLFDEPTTGVDVGGEETIYALLSRLNTERTLAMVLVTHDLAVVHRLSSTVLCLNRTPVCTGPPHETLTPGTLRALFGTEVAYYAHEHAGHAQHAHGVSATGGPPSASGVTDDAAGRAP